MKYVLSTAVAGLLSLSGWSLAQSQPQQAQQLQQKQTQVRAQTPAAPAAASSATTSHTQQQVTRFLWANATVYFLLTDRFLNTNPRNDHAYGRRDDGAALRSFMGGDLAGVTRKIKEGYFNALGVNALWITPPVEQVHGATDEGSGRSYGFHGYWAKDFTRLDASLGSEQDLRELVDTAHRHGIRILLDVVMNHTGPATERDALWPDSWVRLDPVCTYQDVPSTVSCALVKGLPDLKTEVMTDVSLPAVLVEKWKAEGRYEQEVRELDTFFARTGLPRAPRYYLMKWHTDWVRRFGIDGFRADTVKHTEPELWKELKALASEAHSDWKRSNPAKVYFDEPFYMTAEVYGYSLQQGQQFRMDGGSQINYFQYGFDSLINFGFKSDAKGDYETLFSSYAHQLHGPLMPYSVLNYISSHDDDQPFDPLRQQAMAAGTRLLLSPGAAQIYYGDETARDLQVAHASGDAKLRSVMNWDDLKKNRRVQHSYVQEILRHWQKLGRFRQLHPSIGAGQHQQLAAQPYTFSRTLQQTDWQDQVVIALDLPEAQPVSITVAPVFADGSRVRDSYTGYTAIVKAGKVSLPRAGIVALIAQDQ
ncbi:alpha-amylase [Undibacterium sp. CY7W]|uniref:Alpha-amylase n=1 Tax=Undibacterium rugosum TaxID=2762291 RepID=A0A923I6F5_9BURK|nr:alpha-amylase family glycosyl hydrolase [Undibacterium rugosum]MBC3937195.1 alpha-amylase [Undibacterium rugosum]